MLTPAASTTAVVLIDLQTGIPAMPLIPRSGSAVLATARDLAVRFRTVGTPVILVNVACSTDGKDMLTTPVDRPTQIPAGASRPNGRISHRAWPNPATP